MEVIPDELLSHIISFVPFKRKNRLNVLLTSKRFKEVGKWTYNPGSYNNRAIRVQCEKGKSWVSFIGNIQLQVTWWE